MSESIQQAHLVIPDCHGEYEKIAAVVEEYEESVDSFVFLGDVIDGSDSARLIGLIRELGDKAMTVAGNHEWVLRNALSERSDPKVKFWRSDIWPVHENNLLLSYGVKHSPDWESNAERLRETLAANGDLDWLNNLPPYFETEDFIALHAGPRPDRPWEVQASYLDYASSEKVRLEEEPDQIFSSRLATLPNVPLSVDTRVFVTGHAHTAWVPQERYGQRRICLASRVSNGQPLYTWDSATNLITQH